MPASTTGATAFDDTAPGPTVLDMGCGVGGTLFALARVFPRGRFHGITISARQHELAEQLKATEDPGDRCSFLLGDFEKARLQDTVDVIVAVESFVHSGDPGAFLDRAAEHLRPGGALLVVDDFLTEPVESLAPDARRNVERFRLGWRVPGLCTVDGLTRRAEARGLRRVDAQDLTPLVRLGRPRDRVIAFVSPWFERLGLVDVPFFANMIGGNALQAGLRDGTLRYRLVVFEKNEPATEG